MEIWSTDLEFGGNDGEVGDDGAAVFLHRPVPSPKADQASQVLRLNLEISSDKMPGCGEKNLRNQVST